MLRKLGMVDEEGLVTLKGRAACEIDTADELLTTEMMFNGTFNGLDKHQLVALVSCLVPGEKSQVQPSHMSQISILLVPGKKYPVHFLHCIAASLPLCGDQQVLGFLPCPPEGGPRYS